MSFEEKMSGEAAKILYTIVIILAIFLATFGPEKWALAKLVLASYEQKWPFAHFLPTFENGFGQQKVSIHAGLRVVWPLSHFFLLFTLKN